MNNLRGAFEKAPLKLPRKLLKGDFLFVNGYFEYDFLYFFG